MFTSIFMKTIHNVWPMIFIFAVILISIRITYLLCNKKQFVFYKELLMLCFIIYILLLYYIVTFQDNNYGTNNFTPFKEIFLKIAWRNFVKDISQKYITAREKVSCFFYREELNGKIEIIWI